MTGNPFRRGLSSSRLPGNDDSTLTDSSIFARTDLNSQDDFVDPSSHSSFTATQARFPALDGTASTTFPALQSQTGYGGNEGLVDGGRAGNIAQRPDLQNGLKDTITDPFAQWAPATGAKAPYNPFARTLATQEAEVGRVAATTSVQNEENASREEPRARTVMDVDAFKNMLLTGSAGHAPAPASPAVPRFAPQSDTPSLDHSLSQTSLASSSAAFNLSRSLRRNLDNDTDSARDETESVDTDDFLNPSIRSSGSLSPAPSSSGHRVRPRGPQTVSFAEFDQSIPADFHAPIRRLPSTDIRPHGILRPSSLRSASSVSSLNRAAAVSSISEARQESVPSEPSPYLQPPVAVPAAERSESSKKAPPPPPPASRRQGAGPGRPRSATTSSTQSDQDPADIDAPLEPVFDRVIASPPIESPFDHPRQGSEGENKLVPPPPRRRTKANSGRPALDRNASTNSSNASNHTSITNTSSPPTTISFSTPTGPPPPPPPRRAQGTSNRSSIDGSSTSRPSSMQDSHRAIGYSDTNGDKDITSPNGATEDGYFSATSNRDILADMSAFQAEIDALRAKGGS